MTVLHAHNNSGLVLAMIISFCSSFTMNFMYTSFVGRSSYTISASAIVVPETQS